MNDTEYWQNFFRVSGLESLNRDLFTIPSRYIQAMKTALELLKQQGTNDHEINVDNLMNIYENFSRLFSVVNQIQYPERSVYDRCVRYHNRLQEHYRNRLQEMRRHRRLRELNELNESCFLYDPISGEGKYRSELSDDGLKYFDMLYRIFSTNIRELKWKCYEFENAHADYLDADDSEIFERIKNLVEKGNSIVGPLLSELKHSFEKLFNETALEDRTQAVAGMRYTVGAPSPPYSATQGVTGNHDARLSALIDGGSKRNSKKKIKKKSKRKKTYKRKYSKSRKYCGQ